MPVGMVIMRWDERVGAEVCATYPDDVQVTEKTLMQVYSTHEYSGEAGMVSMMVGPLNVASYYTGPEQGYYVMLLLSLDEDPDAYEDGLADVARQVLASLDGDAYKALVPSLFQRVSVYPSLNDEQRLAMTLSDEVKRMVVERLRDEGSVMKSELAVWLKDTYRAGFVDIESTLGALVKDGLVSIASVKGAPSESAFLVADVLVMRAPPVTLVKEAASRGLPAELVGDYAAEVRTYFEGYTPSPEDELKILEVLVDPSAYEVITLLRSAIATRDDLEKLKKKGVEDVDATLKLLWGADLLLVLRDSSGNEYYGLKDDPVVERFFPEYLVNVVRKCYRERTKSDVVLVQTLEQLEDSYYAVREAEKNAKAKAS
ncbi:MAG: hypothetical protein ACTSU5_09985 [Promethearchaeota archaeon]